MLCFFAFVGFGSVLVALKCPRMTQKARIGCWVKEMLIGFSV